MEEELKSKVLSLDGELKRKIMSEVSKNSWRDDEGRKHIRIETVEYILTHMQVTDDKIKIEEE